MKNKQNESNDYKCVLCETGEGERHGLQCSCNKENLTEDEKRILRMMVEDKIEDLGHKSNFPLAEYTNILQKL